MSKRFRPLGWLAAISTLGALAGVMIAASPGSAAAPEKPVEVTFSAECVLAPGTLNQKGTINVTQKGSLPESVSPGEELTAKGNTLTIETPAEWGESFSSLHATTARGKITSTILDVTNGEPSTLQIAKPTEFPTGIPYETKVEPKPLVFTAPSGPEAEGKTSFLAGPVKVTGSPGETLKLTVDTKPGFRENPSGSGIFESTGEGVQSTASGFNAEGTRVVGPVPVSCNAPAGVTVAEVPIVAAASSSTSTSTSTSSTETSSTTTTSPTTTTTSPTTTTTSPTTTTTSPTTTTTSTTSPTTTTTSTSKSTTTISPTTTSTTTTTSAAGAPEVTRVLPPSGPSHGFTPVLIEGRNLSPEGGTCFLFTCSGVTVNFGEKEAFVLFASPERDVVFAPPHAPGTVDVTVTVNGMASATSPADQFTYRGFRFPFDGRGNEGNQGNENNQGDPWGFASGHHHHDH